MKKACRATLIGTFTLGLLAGLTSDAGRAAACENEVMVQLTPVQQMMLAEREVSEGKVASAAWRVRAGFPGIRELGPDAPPLALRAQRIYAMALVRANGQLDGPLGWTRAANFEWAIETLKALDARRGNDPRAQADLAEAGVRIRRTRAAAVKVLEDLDQRDLLGSAFAYLALARARAEAGDEGGALAARRRCAVMSTDRRQCENETWG